MILTAVFLGRSGLRLGPQVLQQRLGCGLGIEDVGGGKPGAAKLGDAITHLIEFFGGMSVCIHDDLAAILLGDTQVQIVQIRAGGFN